MSSRDRRAEGRRRAWGRGPVILRFEPLEDRQLLSSFALGGTGTGLGTSLPASASSTSTSSTTTTTSTDTTQPSGSASSTDSDAGSALTSAVAQATGTSTAAQSLPDLISSALSVSPTKLTWDQTFQATGTVTNQGTATTTEPFSVDLYASPRSQIITGAVNLGSVNVPAGLAPGASYTYHLQTTTPKQPLTYLDGQNFYITAVVDSTDNIKESDEANNVNLGLIGKDAAVVTLGTSASKLQAAGLSVSPGVVQWGQTIDINATVANNGDADAPATNARIVIAPSGQNPTGPLGYTIGSVAVPAAQAGSSVSASQEITLPATPPSELAKYTSFTISMITDSTGAANPVQTSPTFQGMGIDQAPLVIAAPQPAASTPAPQANLVVAAVDAPSAVSWGQTFVVKTNLININSGAAGPFKVGFYLSESDSANTPLLNLGEADVAGLKPGQAVSLSQTLQLPSTVPAGLDPSATAGRIIVRADPEHVIDDSDLSDNALASVPLTLNVVGTDGSTSRAVTTSPGLRQKLNNGTSPSGGNNNPSNNSSNNGAGSTPGPVVFPNPSTGTTPTTPLTPRQARIQARRERMAMLRLYVEERREHRMEQQLRLFHPGRHHGNRPA